MNKLRLLFILLAFMDGAAIGQTQVNNPKINMEVFVDGVKYQLKDGDTLNVSNTEIVVKTTDNLTFDFGLLRFDYPKHFAFQYEETVGLKNWILDGNNFVITYFEFDAEFTLDMFVKEIVNSFGKKNCTVKNQKTIIGNQELKGQRIDVALLGSKLSYDMYALESHDSKSHFISLQDTKNDDGSDSAESIETMKIIGNSIKYK